MAKLGMDAHWRGAIVVSRLLRDAGFEVIYLGHSRPEQVAATARAEDAQIVGLSSLSGNHLAETRRMLAALSEIGMAGQVDVVVGGTVGPSDAACLLADGVSAVFGPGSSGEAIVARFSELARARMAG